MKWCIQLRPLRRLAIALLLFFFVSAGNSSAQKQKKIPCQDGDHYEIDVKQIAVQYQGSSFQGTLNSLTALGLRLTITPTKLQEAALETQQWNEFVKGLVVGYNNCAVSKQQYNEGLQRIYPRLKGDAGDLKQILKLIKDGQKVNEARLRSVLDSYLANLRRFATASQSEIIIERIEALVVGQEKILAVTEQTSGDTQQLLERQKALEARMDALERTSKEAPLATPAEVEDEIQKILHAKADEAEAAYRKGYELLDRYRFGEAIPYLQHALGIIKLPDFYLALGRAYLYEPDLNKAQQILEEGLAQLADGQNQQHEASLAVFLGIVLENKGDLDGALGYAQRAFEIDKKVYGPEHSNVARDANNIGMILENKGDLDGALSYTQQAYEILKKAYGPDHPEVAAVSNNIGTILKAKGDLDGALSYTQQAYEILKKAYGPDHPTVAAGANNIGQILQDKGDLDGALRYAQQALETDKRLYGPDHPQVALDSSNIATILGDKGDLDVALRYARRAMDIDLKVFGPDHPKVAIRADVIGTILAAKGDLRGALRYLQQAFEILQKVYGPEHFTTKRVAANLEAIKQLMK